MRLPSILELRDFRRLWIGQAVSLLGDALYALIFLFMVSKLTNDPVLVGYVGAIQALPFLILSPYAGVVADRYDRRKVMLFSDIASAGVLILFAVAIVILKTPPIWMIFAAAFVVSAIAVFFMPAKSAAVPRLVPPDRLLEANSLSAATDGLMPLISLALSGAVLGAVYKLYPEYFFLSAVLFNAVTFVYSGWCIARLPAIEPQRADLHSARMLDDLKAGMNFIRRNHVLKVVLFLSLLINMFISPFMVVHVWANAQWFGGRPESIAWFEFAFMLGMVPASVAIGKLKIKSPGQSFIWGSVVIGLQVAALGQVPWFWPYLILNFLAGPVLPFITIPINTYFQLIIPDEFRGRVTSAMMMLSQCVRPLGIAVTGLLLAHVSLPAMFAIMGFGMGAAALIGLFDRPFRDSRMPERKVETTEGPPTTELEPAI